jgi:hypothetical protein
MLRPTIPDRSEQRLLLGGLYRVFDVTAVKALPLGKFREEKGSVTQREVDLLVRQQPGKELDSGVPVWECHGHPLLEAVQNLRIHLVRLASCTK